MSKIAKLMIEIPDEESKGVESQNINVYAKSDPKGN